MVITVLVATFLLLFALGVPIAFCLGISTLVTMLMTMDFLPAVATIAQRMAGGVNSFALLAIPLFILMAQLLDRSKVSDKLFEALYVVLGGIKGGLGLAVAAVCSWLGARAYDGRAFLVLRQLPDAAARRAARPPPWPPSSRSSAGSRRGSPVPLRAERPGGASRVRARDE